MFTAVKYFFNMFGFAFTDATIRLILIVLLLLIVIGCGFWFRTEIEDWLGERAYQAEAAHAAAVNAAELDRVKKAADQAQADIAKLSKEKEDLQTKFDSISNNINTAQKNAAPVPKNCPSNNPITQQTIKDLGTVWPTPATPPVDTGVNGVVNKAIQEWKNATKK